MGSKRKSATKHQGKSEGQANGHQQRTCASTDKDIKPSSPKAKNKQGKSSSHQKVTSPPLPSIPAPQSRLPWRLILLLSLLIGGAAIVYTHNGAKSAIDDVYTRHVQPHVLWASDSLSRMFQESPATDAESQPSPEPANDDQWETVSPAPIKSTPLPPPSPKSQLSPEGKETDQQRGGESKTVERDPEEAWKEAKKTDTPSSRGQPEKKDEVKLKKSEKDSADKSLNNGQNKDGQGVLSKQTEEDAHTQQTTGAKTDSSKNQQTMESKPNAEGERKLVAEKEAPEKDGSQRREAVKKDTLTPDGNEKKETATLPVVEEIRVKETLKEDRAHGTETDKRVEQLTEKLDKKPSDKKPSHKKPSGQKPADQKPADQKLSDKKLADQKPADQKPADLKPSDQKPVDQKLSDQKPADQKPSDQKPAHQKPSDQKPVDQKPSDQKPADQKPSDQKPADQKSSDQKPVDQKLSDQKSSDQKPADQKLSDKKPADQKPSDQKPANQKPSKKHVEDKKPANKADRNVVDRPEGKPVHKKPAEAQEGKPAENADQKLPNSKPAAESPKTDTKPSTKGENDRPSGQPTQPPDSEPSDRQRRQKQEVKEEKPTTKPTVKETDDTPSSIPRNNDAGDRQEDSSVQRPAVDRYSKAAITNSADFNIRNKLDAADDLLEKGKLNEALQKYDSILQKHPHSPRAQLGRADTLDKLAEKKRSNQLLEQSIDGYSRLIRSHNDLMPDLVKMAGRRLAQKQQFRGWGGKAAETYKLLTETFPDDLSLQRERGVSHLMTGQNEEARKVFDQILKVEPTDGFSQVHLGFIIKTHDNYPQAALPLLQAGIDSGHEGTQDGRFFFHLGDAYQRLGQHDKARRVYERGAEVGLFLSADQRSLYNVDTLTGRPWWTPEQTGYQKYLKLLEDNWRTIRDEGLKQLDSKTGMFRPEAENLREKGEWKQLTLFQQGRQQKKNCEKVPKTCALIEQIPDAKGCRRGQVKFSVMSPGVHVWPHCGPTNCRIRAHLGLVVPEGPKIRVVNETRTWMEGKFIIFDDSFEHEVWHDGTSTRLVLIVDFWHPEVTQAQKRLLPPI